MRNEFEELLRQCRRGRNDLSLLSLNPRPMVVSLASCNPHVPLERQRERISDAQKQLIEDENRKLKEWEAQKQHERLLMERQKALDWHMEQKRLNEEWERKFVTVTMANVKSVIGSGGSDDRSCTSQRLVV